MKKHLHLRGLGDIYPYCCNFDLCNVDMCTSMGLQKGHSLCTTTIEHKLKELQHKPNLADVEIIAPIANSNSNKVNICFVTSFGDQKQKCELPISLFNPSLRIAISHWLRRK